MDWSYYITETYKKVVNDAEIKLFEPISKYKLEQLENEIGVKLSGDLLEVLKETNGILDERWYEWCVYTSERMIEAYHEHRNFLKETGIKAPCEMFFFSDNACGESIGFKVNHGIIVTGEVGMYFPIENRFEVIAPDFKTWVSNWN